MNHLEGSRGSIGAVVLPMMISQTAEEIVENTNLMDNVLDVGTGLKRLKY